MKFFFLYKLLLLQKRSSIWRVILTFDHRTYTWSRCTFCIFLPFVQIIQRWQKIDVNRFANTIIRKVNMDDMNNFLMLYVGACMYFEIKTKIIFSHMIKNCSKFRVKILKKLLFLSIFVIFDLMWLLNLIYLFIVCLYCNNDVLLFTLFLLFWIHLLERMEPNSMMVVSQRNSQAWHKIANIFHIFSTIN